MARLQSPRCRSSRNSSSRRGRGTSPTAARLLSALPAALACLIAGCSEELTPISVLEETRVLAIVADPLEAGPGDEVTVSALVHEDPDEPVVEETWTFCPVTSGARGAFTCVDSACETAVPPSLTVNPYALAEACLAALGGSVPGGGAEVPAEVESVFRLRVQTGPRAAAGLPPREAVLRLPLSAEAPSSRNRPPVITEVTVGGTAATPGAVAGTLAAAGGRLALDAAIDPGSIDTYLDDTGRTLTESVVVSFYTTAGRFTDDRGEAPLATTVLEADELRADATEARLWIVARDLRGGQAWTGPFLVEITR